MSRVRPSRLLPVVVALQALFALPAYAQQFTVIASTTDTASKTLALAQAGVVQTAATLTTSGNTVAIAVGAGTAQSITNSGSISQTGTGRAVNNGSGAAALTLTNNAGAMISAAAADAIKIDVTGSTLRLNNEGTISVTTPSFDSGQAIDMKKLFSGSSTLNNGSALGSRALIQSNGSDGIRIGSRTTLVNYGSIIGNGKTNTSSGSADGVDDDDAAHVGIVIQNFALITGARHGVTLKSTATNASQTQITNSINGRIIGYNGSGVGSDGAGIVTNYGLVSGRYAGAGNIFTSAGVASLNGDGDGVDIDGTGTVNNYGRIEGLDGGGVDSGGRPNGGDGVAMGGGSVTNFAGGVIWGKSNGILVDDGGNGTDATNLAGNKNRGTSVAAPSAVTIINSGQITGDRKVGIGLVGNWDDTVVNNASGVITGGLDTQQVDKLSTDLTQTPGAAIQMGAGNDTLTNFGKVEGKNGLAIDMGAGDDVTRLFNGGGSGVVMGTINGGTGIDTLETGGTHVFAAGTVINFERFIVRSGSTTFNYGLGSVSSVQVDAGASLQVNGALSTTGDVTLNGTFMAAAAAAPRSVAVGGNLAMGAASVLQAGVGGAVGNDSINAAGTAVLANGASIAPVARGYVPNGAVYTVVSAAGGLTATPANLQVLGNSALVSYTLAKVGNDLRLTAQRQTTLASVLPVELGGMASALDAQGQAGGGANAFLAALDNQTSLQAVREALLQAAPESNRASQQASQAAMGAAFSAFESRIDTARSGATARAPLGAVTGLAGGGSNSRRSWVQALGAQGEQGQRASSSSYKLYAYGLAAGFEVDRQAHEVMGLSLAVTQAGSEGTSTARGDDVRISAVNLGGYFSQNRSDVTLDASLLLGQSTYKSQRVVVFPGFLDVATGSYKGWQLAGRVEAGFPFAINTAWSGRWLVGARAGYLTTDGYTEVGNVAIAQRVAASSSTSLQSVLGAELTQTLSPTSSLQLRGRYLRELANAPGVTAAFVSGGPSFTTGNAAPNRNTLQLGVGFRHLSAQGVSFTFAYDAEAKEKFLSHQLSARANWAF